MVAAAVNQSRSTSVQYIMAEDLNKSMKGGSFHNGGLSGSKFLEDNHPLRQSRTLAECIDERQHTTQASEPAYMDVTLLSCTENQDSEVSNVNSIGECEFMEVPSYLGSDVPLPESATTSRSTSQDVLVHSTPEDGTSNSSSSQSLDPMDMSIESPKTAIFTPNMLPMTFPAITYRPAGAPIQDISDSEDDDEDERRKPPFVRGSSTLPDPFSSSYGGASGAQASTNPDEIDLSGSENEDMQMLARFSNGAPHFPADYYDVPVNGDSCVGSITRNRTGGSNFTKPGQYDIEARDGVAWNQLSREIYETTQRNPDVMSAEARIGSCHSHSDSIPSYNSFDHGGEPVPIVEPKPHRHTVTDFLKIFNHDDLYEEPAITEPAPRPESFSETRKRLKYAHPSELYTVTSIAFTPNYRGYTEYAPQPDGSIRLTVIDDTGKLQHQGYFFYD